MQTMKSLGVFALVGLVLGAVVATLVMPGILAWHNTPGVGQALCDCVQITRQTAAQLIKAQLWGMAVGALGTIGLKILLGVTGKKSSAPNDSPH